MLNELKQKIKIVIDLFRGDREVLSKTKIYRTLNSHILAYKLDGLIDEYVFISNLSIRNKLPLNCHISVLIKYAIVKNRCESFLDKIFDEYFSRNAIQEIKLLIKNVFELEKKIWSRQVFNTDLMFLENTIIKDDELLLRDLGALTNDPDTAIDFLKNAAPSQINDQKKILMTRYSIELADYYEEIALEFFTQENMLYIWNN